MRDADESEDLEASSLLRAVARMPEGSLGLPVAAGDVIAGRFELRRQLGAGGMGVVYEARDRRHGGLVALKTLQQLDAEMLLRLKREFREVAGITHRNLVRLDELMDADGRWILVMERVGGNDLISAIRSPAAKQSGAGVDAFARTLLEADGSSGDGGRLDPPGGRSSCPSDLARLRGAFTQLAEGLMALHERRRIHCDIKPSNVLVEPSGRAVILDFGLVRAADGGAASRDAGTPLYMAPEQVEGFPLGPEVDWYAFGVMLYQALTGRLPHEGTVTEILLAKCRDEPRPPLEIAEGVPSDLEALAIALLRRDPAARPRGAEVLEALRPVPTAMAREPVSVRDSAPFVGRARELAALEDGWSRARRGRCVTVHVRGPSGLGKTTLLEQFVARVEARTLRGRCFERETVPFKALDSLVDALASLLLGMREVECAALLPRDISALARLFPVLNRVAAIAQMPLRATYADGADELRRRASLALRELLSRLADRRPLLVWIDDLQWGDVDSAKILLDLVAPPDAPAMLLVLSYRPEDERRSPCLRRLQGLAGFAGETPQWERLDVTPLDPEATGALADALLGERASSELRTRVIDDTDGSPLFVVELARALALQDAGARSLSSLLRLRVAGVSDGARALVEALSVAKGPLRQRVALAAASVGANAPDALSQLRAARLVRSSGPGADDILETAHDRIREAVLEGLAEDRIRELHVGIARALDEHGDDDLELLATHLRAAGEVQRAAELLLRAAARAEQTLAFEHAARLYRSALDSGVLGREQRRDAQASFARALAHAGASAEAAIAYFAAAEVAATEESVELEIAGAEQFLRAGRIDEGVRAMRGLFESLGMLFLETQFGGIAAMAMTATRIALGGLELRPRATTEIDPLDLRRLGACRGALFMSSVDDLFSLQVSLRMLELALRAGSEEHAYLALVFTRAQLAALRSPERLLGVMERAQAKMDPSAAGALGACLEFIVRGIRAFFVDQRWEAGGEQFQQAVDAMQSEPGANWEISFATCMACWCHYLGGRFADCFRMARGVHAVGFAREDLYATNSASPLVSFGALAAGDVAAARRLLDCNARWSQRGFHNQHYHHTLALGRIARASVDGQGLLEFERTWPALSKSNAFNIPFMAIDARSERGHTAIAACLAGGAQRKLLRIAEEQAQKVDKDGYPTSRALASILRASIAKVRGDRRFALNELERAEELTRRAGMGSWVEVVRRCRGLTLAGSEGAKLVEEAERALREDGVAAPAMFCRVLIAGFDE